MSHPSSHHFPAKVLLDAIDWLDNDGDLADLLGVHRRTIVRWRREGTRLTVSQADGYAVRAGYHPEELWEFCSEVAV